MNQLFNDYIAIADKIGVRRKQEETVFGMRLRSLFPISIMCDVQPRSSVTTACRAEARLVLRAAVIGACGRSFNGCGQRVSGLR